MIDYYAWIDENQDDLYMEYIEGQWYHDMGFFDYCDSKYEEERI